MAFDATTTAADVAEKIDSFGAELESLAPQNEKLSRLSPRTAEILREAGVMRILQPRSHGGLEGTPEEFLTAVIATARRDPAAGWVAGVVGVHPWEVALMGQQTVEDVWGVNQDTWVASPYNPSGIAEPVEGGYILSGHWQFSSGTDHSDWVFLGAVVGNGQGAPAMPPRVLHVLVPRKDYQIIEDSWDVIGLLGTGSRDVVVQGAFIPTHHTLAYDDVASGKAAEGLENPIYQLPFSTIFPVGITGAIIGMAEGALVAHAAYQRDRVSAAGGKIRDDAYAAYFTGEAGAEIHASRLQLFDGINWAYDHVMSGKTLTFADRARIRRNQVRCAWRAVGAIDQIYARSGGNASRVGNPIQRIWRDAHVGLNHFIHVPGPTYHAQALTEYDVEVPFALQMGI